jgi:O-antigen ligase
MSQALAVEAPSDRLDQLGALAVFGIAASVLFSIAVAQILLAIAIACWLGVIVVRRERVEVPAFFWPLAAYAGITLVSAAFSIEPRVSLVDCKQLVLFLMVPIVYRFITGERASTMVTVILSFAAASAAYGIIQYATITLNPLSQRPHGTLGHYMTYSGLLMLVISVALARILFGRSDRMWAAVVMPALAVAVVVTLSRSAWVGACAAAALLLALKDFRLLAVLPILAAVFFATAPPTVMARFVSIFDVRDPTNRDRMAMLREGEHMIAAHPLVGVGPNMVQVLYSEYRDPEAVEKINPHLHNVPVQIAAERGLPALAIWLWFIAALMVAAARRFHAGGDRFLAAAALAAITAMLTAGMFEYNFGDSEFLMMFLIIVTLPFAADRAAPA